MNLGLWLAVSVSMYLALTSIDKIFIWYRETDRGKRQKLEGLKSADRIANGEPNFKDKLIILPMLPFTALFAVTVVFLSRYSERIDNWIDDKDKRDRKRTEEIRELEESLRKHS